MINAFRPSPIRNLDGFLRDSDDEDDLLVDCRQNTGHVLCEDYLIVIPLSLLDPFRQPKNLPGLLKRSQHYIETADWEETLKLAMRLAHQSNYSFALSMAREIMSRYGAASMDEVYRVIDWLHDIYGAIIEIYNKLHGRPYQELSIHRLVNKEDLYLRVLPL
jgi:hypothetical protein